MMEVKNNIIMKAGSSPIVGKSFVSVNLVAIFKRRSRFRPKTWH